MLPGSRLQDYSSIIFHRVSQAQLTGFLATLALAVGIEHIHIAGEDYDLAVIVAFDLLSMHPHATKSRRRVFGNERVW